LKLDVVDNWLQSHDAGCGRDSLGASDMVSAHLRARGQITIPSEIRKAAHLEEGDVVEMEVTEDGILLRPVKDRDPDQWWFWTPEWQAGERRASADIKAGRTVRYESDEEFLAALENGLPDDADV